MRGTQLKLWLEEASLRQEVSPWGSHSGEGALPGTIFLGEGSVAPWLGLEWFLEAYGIVLGHVSLWSGRGSGEEVRHITGQTPEDEPQAS